MSNNFALKKIKPKVRDKPGKNDIDNGIKTRGNNERRGMV